MTSNLEINTIVQDRIIGEPNGALNSRNQNEALNIESVKVE